MVFFLSDPYIRIEIEGKRMRSFCWHRQPYNSKVHAIAVSSFVSTYLISSDECNIIPHTEYEMMNQRMIEWLQKKKKNVRIHFENSLWNKTVTGVIKFSCWMAERIKEARAQRSTYQMNEQKREKNLTFGRCVFLACIDKYWWAVIFDDIARWIREWLVAGKSTKIDPECTMKTWYIQNRILNTEQCADGGKSCVVSNRRNITHKVKAKCYKLQIQTYNNRQSRSNNAKSCSMWWTRNETRKKWRTDK